MTAGTTAATLTLGFVLGLRHATEADHIVAVSTIVSQRRSLLAAAAVGAHWGLGHTAALLLAGLLVAFAGLAIPPGVAAWLEVAVAAMIVALGASLLWSTRVTAGAAAPDVAPGRHGRHAAAAQVGWRPVAVGMMHGLAGSATLMLLIQAEIVRDASPLAGLPYLLMFGVGSTAGMLLMGVAIGLPFALGAGLFAPLLAGLQRLAGAGSVLFGLWYGWRAW